MCYPDGRVCSMRCLCCLSNFKTQGIFSSFIHYFSRYFEKAVFAVLSVCEKLGEGRSSARF